MILSHQFLHAKDLAADLFFYLHFEALFSISIVEFIPKTFRLPKSYDPDHMDRNILRQ